MESEAFQIESFGLSLLPKGLRVLSLWKESTKETLVIK